MASFDSSPNGSVMAKLQTERYEIGISIQVPGLKEEDPERSNSEVNGKKKRLCVK